MPGSAFAGYLPGWRPEQREAVEAVLKEKLPGWKGTLDEQQ